MARKKNDKMLRGEKLLYLLIGILVFGNILVHLFLVPFYLRLTLK